MNKKIVIIAGPNGAGKTTFAREFLPNEAHCPIFINADLIAAGIAPFMPEQVSIKAGRIMLSEITEHVAKDNSFAFETTLSGLSYARAIPKWRAKGYHVKLIFYSYLTPIPLFLEYLNAYVKAAIIFPRPLFGADLTLA